MPGSDSSPLAGRRIVVTRALEQSENLFRRLRELGAEVLALPTVCFVEPPETPELDRAIAELPEFDWLIFTSVNAARFFLARCRKLNVWTAPSGPRMAAVGPATRAALEDAGLRVAFVPREFTGGALAAELGSEMAGQRVLLPRSDRAGAELPEALRRAGAIVTEAIAYRTAEPASLDAQVLARIRRGDADAAAFFSPSAFHHFARALGNDALREAGTRLAFAAVGPVTAAAIREAGLPVAVEAREATTESLVAALGRHFTLRGAAKGRS